MESLTPAFIEAEHEFRAFLRSQGWPTDVLWLERGRLLGWRRTHWVFRPEELTSSAAVADAFEALRQKGSSIRMDAKWQLAGRSLAYVQEYASRGGKLNLGVAADRESWPIRPVSSRALWAVLRAIMRVVGESPFLTSTRIASGLPTSHAAAP
jgi:hypothetical protein